MSKAESMTYEALRDLIEPFGWVVSSRLARPFQILTCPGCDVHGDDWPKEVVAQGSFDDLVELALAVTESVKKVT